MTHRTIPNPTNPATIPQPTLLAPTPPLALGAGGISVAVLVEGRALDVVLSVELRVLVPLGEAEDDDERDATTVMLRDEGVEVSVSVACGEV